MVNTPTDSLIGSTISHYEIVAKLGGGGMGVVYKATDTKLGRTVALKFLPPEWSHDESAKDRFWREAQAASATNHPNVCVIHTIDHTDDGRLFIVMAYYEGQTLKQKLEGGPLSLFDALEIASGVAEGLAKAHAQGVVHRDIKPGNLIVTDDGVKVLDFGLAKFHDALQLTIPGSTVGTVAYMSPEQARGEEADARSDVWALGVVLYEMLTGEVPFKGTYPEAVFYAIKNEPVPPLRVAGGESPAPVESLVLRALEKDSAKRYQSAREMARDLRLLQGRTVPVDLLTGPVPFPSATSAKRVLGDRGRLRRAVTPVRALAALVVLLAVAAVSSRWLSRPVVRVPIAIAPVANHTGEPELDAYRLALTAALADELDESPNIRAVPYRRLIEVLRRFTVAGNISGTEAIQAISLQSGAAFVVVPSLEYRTDNSSWFARVEVRTADSGTTANTYDTEGLVSTLPKDAAFRLIASAADLVQRHFRTNGPGQSYTARPAAIRLRNIEAARSFEEGVNSYEQREYSAALDGFRRAVERDDQHAMTHAWLTRVWLTLRQPNEAVASAKRAKQLVTPETPTADAALIDGLLAESQGEYQEAERHYRRQASLRPDVAAAVADLADFLQRQNRHQEAVQAYRDVLRLDSSYVAPHVDLCQQYWWLDEQPLGAQEAQSALEKYRLVGNRTGEAHALLCLGDLQRRQGGPHLSEARRNIEGARDIFSSLELPFGLARAYQYLGVVAGEAGNYPEAARFFEESLARSRQVGNRPLEGLELMNLGVAYQNMGQKGLALKYFQQSRDVHERNGDEEQAAAQEINAASLMVDAGNNVPDALRRVRNALATLRKRDSIQFELLGIQVEAVSQVYAGSHTEGRRALNGAIARAKERQLNNKVLTLSLKLSESYFLNSEYEAARKIVEDAAASDSGRDDPEVLYSLGRILTRLGDVAGARKRLDAAFSAVGKGGRTELLPVAHLAMGELNLESDRLTDARLHFDKAAASGADDLPDAAGVEATCYLGLLDASGGRSPGAGARVGRSAERAMSMGRLSLAARCRLYQARILFAERNYDQALAALNVVSTGDSRQIGLELEAQTLYWRERLSEARSDLTGDPSDATRAKALIEQVQASLPGDYREMFAARPDIRPILSASPVKKSR